MPVIVHSTMSSSGDPTYVFEGGPPRRVSVEIQTLSEEELPKLNSLPQDTKTKSPRTRARTGSEAKSDEEITSPPTVTNDYNVKHTGIITFEYLPNGARRVETSIKAPHGCKRAPSLAMVQEFARQVPAIMNHLQPMIMNTEHGIVLANTEGLNPEEIRMRQMQEMADHPNNPVYDPNSYLYDQRPSTSDGRGVDKETFEFEFEAQIEQFDNREDIFAAIANHNLILKDVGTQTETADFEALATATSQKATVKKVNGPPTKQMKKKNKK